MGYRRLIEWSGIEEVRAGLEPIEWIALAGVATSIGSVVSSSQKSGPKTPPMPKETDPSVREAAEREAALLRRKRGQASTILTGGEGIITSPTTQQTVLGG